MNDNRNLPVPREIAEIIRRAAAVREESLRRTVAFHMEVKAARRQVIIDKLKRDMGVKQ